MGTGVTPQDRGRFTGFDTLSQVGHWDHVTRDLVMSRVGSPPAVRFFDDRERVTADALCDQLLAQHAEPRIPVVAFIDARLLDGEGDGYRYHDMPEDGDAWRRSLAALDDVARTHHGAHFAELDRPHQRELLEGVRLEEGDWYGMPAARVFGLWTRYATTAFYSHPWSWNEIGFPGPAYPRGYKTLTLGSREPFETPEQDPRDPIPWVEKAEAAKRAHAEAPEPSAE